jgi:hypothetical protein
LFDDDWRVRSSSWRRMRRPDAGPSGRSFDRGCAAKSCRRWPRDRACQASIRPPMRKCRPQTDHADIKSYFDTLRVRLNGPRPSVRSTADWRYEPIRSPTPWIGMPPSAPIRAHPGSRNLSPSTWSRAGSSALRKSRPNGDPTFPHVPSRPKPLSPCEATGAIENNLHWTLDVTFNQ